MYDDNGKAFINMFYNVLFASNLCNSLFSNITLLNLVHTCLFKKGFCTFIFSANEHNSVTFPRSAHRNREYLVLKKGKIQNHKSNFPPKHLCNYCIRDVLGGNCFCGFEFFLF